MNKATNRLVRETFVELADTMVADYDVIDFLDTLARRVVELLGVTASGVLLADHHGELTVMAASSEQTRLLELFQLQNSQGPCLECFRTGGAVDCQDLVQATDRWPLFAPAAVNTGFTTVHALPLRLREQIIGALNLFGTTPDGLEAGDIELAQALADVATIGILHERTLRRQTEVTEQLQIALNSRVLIEQAKGVLAEQLGLSVDQAFVLLRDHARSTNTKITAVAEAIVDGGLQLTTEDRTRPAASR